MIYTTYSKQDVLNATAQAAMIETYEETGLGRGIHTDNLRYIGTGSFDNREIESLPYDENGNVEVYIEVMDKSDYETSVLANSSEEWPEDLADDDTIAVVVVKKNC